MSETNRPVAEIYDKGIKAAIWPSNNENGPPFQTKISKVYKDKATGKYKETPYLSGVDLLLAEKVAGEAYQTERQLVREYYQANERRAQDTRQSVAADTNGDAFDVQGEQPSARNMQRSRAEHRQNRGRHLRQS